MTHETTHHADTTHASSAVLPIIVGSILTLAWGAFALAYVGAIAMMGAP